MVQVSVGILLRHLNDEAMSSQLRLYTIGYSPHTLEGMVNILQKHGIGLLADVRSHPYSARRPEFNHKNLKKVLPGLGIGHLFLGRELGARCKDPSVCAHGRADYALIAGHPLFEQGLQRLRQELEKHALVLMCAEKEPLHCHRTILIARSLRKEVQIRHILADGSLEEHQNAEQRLLELHGLLRPRLPGLDSSLEERLARAYLKQGHKIAWRVQGT